MEGATEGEQHYNTFVIILFLSISGEFGID